MEHCLNALTFVLKAPEADTTSSRSSVNSSIVNNKLPTHSDCLVGYATVKGFAAMRNTKHGSWYIQALVRVGICDGAAQYSYVYQGCSKNTFFSNLTHYPPKIVRLVTETPRTKFPHIRFTGRGGHAN